MSYAAAAAAADGATVLSTLQQLAARLTAEGHPLQAIKCYVGMLGQSMLPPEEAAARLRLGQLLLEHTLNVQDAKQQLQKAEMLVLPLPGQHLLKCEVLAALAATHQLLGETDFQRRCFTKGQEVCKDAGATSADKRCLVEWSIYFYLHLAESLVAKGPAQEAAQQVAAAAAVASTHGMLQQQVLCSLFQLQLALMQAERQDLSAITDSVTELLQQLEAHEQQQNQEQQQQLTAADRRVNYLKLYFLTLHVMTQLQSGSFKELQVDTKQQKSQGQKQQEQQQQEQEQNAAQSVIEQMDGLLQQLLQAHEQQQESAPGSSTAQQALPFECLPLPLLAATVHLLAAVVDKNGGKQKQGQALAGRGLEVLEQHLAVLRQDKAAATDAPAQSRIQQELRACLVLRLLLLETRQQLHLLSSNFAAARADAVESIWWLGQYPRLLAGLAPVVHVQAGLYAQAVGAHSAAVGHFLAAAGEAQGQGQGALNLAADARHMAALCYVADGNTESVNKARELVGPTTNEGDTSQGYASRCLYHTTAGLLQLSGVNVGSDERADAKQHFSRGLKMAHKHLHNHQVVSQLLMLMAPLQLAAADAAGAKQMISSSVQLAHGANELHTQVSGLGMMKALLDGGMVATEEEVAKNRNYLARKEEELSNRLQETEADAQQHHLVLSWGL